MSVPLSHPKWNKPASDVPFPYLSPVEPRHRAISLYWMYFADQATKNTHDRATLTLLESYSPVIAGELLYMRYQLDVAAEAIRTYYEQARKNAESANIRWDERAVASILRKQGSDPVTFDGLRDSLDQHDMEVKPPKPDAPFLFVLEGGFFFVFDLGPRSLTDCWLFFRPCGNAILTVWKRTIVLR